MRYAQFMRLPALGLLVLTVAGAAACTDLVLSEPAPDVAKPKHVRAMSVAFDYPGNWRLEQDERSLGETIVNEMTLDGAGSAIVLIHVFRPALDIRAMEMMKIVRDSIIESIDGVVGTLVNATGGQEVDAFRTFLGGARKGRLAHMTFAMLGVKVPHTLEVYTFETDNLTVAVAMQSADEDRKKAEPAFALIEKSFRLLVPVTAP